MANILEFLRSVLTTPEGTAAFRDAPRDHLVSNGFTDLTGEDVATALDALRSSLPAAASRALGGIQGDLTAGARPAEGEDELDAAVRVLQQAVDAVPAPSGGATRRSSGDHAGAEAASAGASASVDTASGPPVVEPTAPDLSALPVVEAFRESLEAAAARAADDARALTDRIAELFAQLDREIAELRAAAAEDVARWRAESEADREAARAALTSIDADAEVLRQKAESNAERIEAEARAAAEGAEQELAARWAELEREEAKLRERVANIDSLFKSVLADDASSTAETPV